MKKALKNSRVTLLATFFAILTALFPFSCANQTGDGTEEENTPTAGKLTVYCDEAFIRKIGVQAITFESQYPKTAVKLVTSAEPEAVKALYENNAELIIIGRDLNATEKKAFSSKQYTPTFSGIAVSGLALITNTGTPIVRLTQAQVISLITNTGDLSDSASNPINVQIVFDKNNSSVMNYVRDSIARNKPFSKNCSSLGTSLEAIQYAKSTKNAIALIDYAWLSDQDDSLFKAVSNHIRFLAIETAVKGEYALPGQSSFKLRTYPYCRTLYAFKKTGDFTLAKGFESYLAGPKGQLTFLKQGLLPTRQGERSIHINVE